MLELYVQTIYLHLSHVKLVLLYVEIFFFVNLVWYNYLLCLHYFFVFFLRPSFFFFGFALPDIVKAIAMICFIGFLPSFFILRILAEIAFCDFPFLSGIIMLLLYVGNLHNGIYHRGKSHHLNNGIRVHIYY